MSVTGSIEVLRILLKDPVTQEAKDAASNTLKLEIVRPDGTESVIAQAELTHDGTGKYHKNVVGSESGLWHYRWLVSGASVAEGTFEMESEWDVEDEGGEEEPDLTDLKVLVPRARRKVEGPWGNANGKPALANGQLYEMVADACGEIIMLGGSLFGHQLEVKARDSLVGFPTEWKTDTALEEFEAAIICAQVALNYYFHAFNNLKVSETILNEGTSWEYQLSANVIKEYLRGVIDERDKAIAGLRVNHPVLDRYASNVRVRDQATVSLLEWWDTVSPAYTGGGLPSGQEVGYYPVFHG